MVCFDLSGFTGLPFGTALQYKLDWGTFDRIQAYNSNVSTARAAGTQGLTYYTYASGNEQISFINGQNLHYRRYPDSNWNEVQKN
jgi:hypothetical protein